jgi:hypothetical protein
MSVYFEQENFNRNQNTTSPEGSPMALFLIKKGIVKNTEDADTILILAALLSVGLSVYLFIFGFNLPERTVPQAPIEEVPSSEQLEL